MFEETGILHSLKEKIRLLSEKTTVFTGVLLTSVVSIAVSCNQTLSIMLTQQLCSELEPDASRMAIDLENSTAVIAALIPWCIACAVPLATIDAPMTAVPFACYLYLIPLIELIRSRGDS